MNIDLILTEWCFRLPTGYPTCSKDYETLYQVILEISKVTPEHARQIVERAQNIKSQIITEAVQFDSIENRQLISVLEEYDKLAEFREFLQLLPVEANEKVLAYCNNLSVDNSIEFANLLYSQTEVNEEQLTNTNYKTGVAGSLFKLEPKGLGKGEILLSALIKGAAMQGSGQSFDLLSNARPYEVKDYHLKNSSIRLGTKASVTRFPFWDEIVTTMKRLNQLRGTLQDPKFDLREYFDQPLLDAIAHLDSRREFILAGNLNLKDKKYLDQFYQEANLLQTDIQGYTNVILRGPNAKPIEMSIEPITGAAGESIIVKPVRDNSHNITYINTELRRLKYVRNPADLNVDLQEAVDTIVGDLQFIVFRKDRVRVTSDFQYVVIDTGKIRIIEKAINPIDVDLGDITNEEAMN